MRLTKRQRTSLGMSLGFGLFILALTARSANAASADTQPQFWRIVDTVYDDELGASWEDQSSCPHDLADTTKPHNGLVSISFTPEAGTGLQFYSPDGITDFGGRYENALSFQLSCSASSLSTLGLQLIGSSSSKSIGSWMPLTSFLQPTYDPTLSSDWLALVAPFASFGIKPLDFVSGFVLVAMDDTVQFVDPTYIDDVWILEPTDGTFSVPTPIEGGSDNENNANNNNNNNNNNDGEDDIDDLKSSGADSSFNLLSSLFGNETSEEGSSFTELVTSSLYIILFLSVLGVVVLGAVIGLISRYAWKQYSYQKIKAKPFVTPMTLYSQSPSPFFSQA